MVELCFQSYVFRGNMAVCCWPRGVCYGVRDGMRRWARAENSLHRGKGNVWKSLKVSEGVTVQRVCAESDSGTSIIAHRV